MKEKVSCHEKMNHCLAAKRCRWIGADLWDIETINELFVVLNRIYRQTRSFDNPRIAVNWTQGKEILQLQKRINEAKEISISSTNDYAIVYRPLIHLPAKKKSFLFDISHGTHRISLEEKFHSERRSNRYICKRSSLIN